jgi:hypothetical protein
MVVGIVACSGLARSEQEKARRKNAKGEYIYRSHKDIFAPIGTPQHAPRSPYPWETEAHLPRITKEFFRCKGNPLNASLVDTQASMLLSDCEGCTRHGLPILNGKENVYPTLLDLLNFLQKKTGRRVVVTCGHRCPTHNLYADCSKENKTSKHQIGAEVDFYIQGMEDQPLEAVGLLMQYYQEHPSLKHLKEWTLFQRSESSEEAAFTSPWYNKEIAIRLYQKNEGRDADNRHPYPYISVQIRFDRQAKTKVTFDWEKASRGYPRS